MTRDPSDNITSDELTAFLGNFFDRYMSDGKPVPPDIHPVDVLSKMKVKSAKRAELGLRMTVADCLEMTSPWTPAQVAEADSFLNSMRAISLSDLRRRFRGPK